AVGEESNNLEKVLLDVADGLEKRTSRQLELFVRLLEPIMLLVMAGVVLVIVLALLMPIFRMSSAIGLRRTVEARSASEGPESLARASGFDRAVRSCTPR